MLSLESCEPNNWLNAIILRSKDDRDNFLSYTNDRNIMTRPIWRLTHSLPMNKNYFNDGLKNSYWLEERVVNIPSSVPENTFSKYDETL